MVERWGGACKSGFTAWCPGEGPRVLLLDVCCFGMSAAVFGVALVGLLLYLAVSCASRSLHLSSHGRIAKKCRLYHIYTGIYINI